MKRLLGTYVLIPLLLGSPVMAADIALASPARLVATFQAICLDGLETPETRRTAAIGAPWNFVFEGRESDGEERFRSADAALGIRSDGDQLCGVTEEVEPPIDLHSVQAAMSAAWGFDEGMSLVEPGSKAWIIGTNSGNEFLIGLKVSNSSGTNLATLTVQKRRPAT